MRIFGSLSELINETARELFSRGIVRYDLTRQGKVAPEPAKELLGYVYRLTGYDDKDQFFALAREITGRDFHRKEIAEAWFQDMISKRCSNPQPHWFMHPDLEAYYYKYCRDPVFNGESYTYCERIHWQVDIAIKLLLENPERRAAVIGVWDPLYDVPKIGKHRVPCSMFYQFLAIREVDRYRLDMIYVQRSCDFVWFFPFDVYRAVRLLEYVTDELNRRDVEDRRWAPGNLVHFIGSLHAFESDVPERWKW